MKIRNRGEKGRDSKGQFERRTARWVALAFIGCCVVLLVGTATYFALTNQAAELKGLVNLVLPLMTAVLMYYFRGSDK